MNRALTSPSAHSRRGPLARLGDWLPAWFGERRRLRTRIHALTDALQRQSGVDPLTGLPNRAALLDELREQVGSETGRVGLALIGIDKVEAVRHTLGHDQGDALILATVERVRAAIGAHTFLARLDGGELAIVSAPVDDGNEVTVDAPRLLDVVATPLLLVGGEVVSTASIGLVDPPTAGPVIDPMELLRQASVALGLARDAGGGRIEHYVREIDEQAGADVRLAAELRRAIPDHELEVYYQPIVSLPDRRLAGAEALIRWNHPRHGVLTPDRWLEVADAAGLLPEIGRATLDEVCRRFGTVSGRTAGPSLRIAVNLAPSELRHADLVPAVGAILERSGLDPAQLVIEVSDRAVLDDVAAAAILDLRRLGVRIALDDFGTGLAAIGRLGHLPIDELKLDDSVVSGVSSGGVEQSVLESIVGLCTRLGIDVVAEGVSNESDTDALAALGCQYAQGWMFGRPVPFSRFVAMLDRMQEPEELLDPTTPPSPRSESGRPLGSLP